MSPARPALLLTRPEPASRRFLKELGFDGQVVISPLLEIRPLDADLPAAAGLILTSEHAVPAAAGYAGLPVFCVGAHTAAMAGAAGLDVQQVAQDAEHLVAMIANERPAAPLLHLRGEHARGEIAAQLTVLGIPTAERVVYAQLAQPLSPAARELLAGPVPVVVPLFSPRSATILAEQGPYDAPLSVVAISPAAAAAARPLNAPASIAAMPDSPGMIAAVRAALAACAG